ncbi:MAG: hypothetical protein LIO56_04840 [Lachnospiraceae bacterium]|nr:hypothetical protein [Lachnospiraceae bacterium]
MADTLTVLSVVSFLLAGVLGMASVALWLQLDIFKILGELTGRSAKRSARRAREASEQETEDVTKQLDNIMIVHTDEVI